MNLSLPNVTLVGSLAKYLVPNLNIGKGSAPTNSSLEETLNSIRDSVKSNNRKREEFYFSYNKDNYHISMIATEHLILTGNPSDDLVDIISDAYDFDEDNRNHQKFTYRKYNDRDTYMDLTKVASHNRFRSLKKDKDVIKDSILPRYLQKRDRLL